jgi:hypothetical protein
MTKGQVEFLVAISVIIVSLGFVGTIIYADHNLPTPVKPIASPIVLPNSATPAPPIIIPTTTPAPIVTPPHPTLTPTATPTAAHCIVLIDIHVNMTKDEVEKLCGKPDIIDTTSTEVKRIEKIFKADEIWYYIAYKATVEITDGFVTKVLPLTITQDLLPSQKSPGTWSNPAPK